MRLIFILSALFLTLFAKQEYTISIVPQFTNSVIQKDWEPIIDEISKQTGVKFTIKYYPTIPEFEKAFLDGKVDFAYMNPYHAVMAHNAKGYKPILRAGKPLVGILVTKKDSQIKKLSDLNQKEIAFPSPNAFAASLLIRATLSEDEHISFKPKYVKTHSNVYKEVLLNLCEAGGGVNKTLSQEPEDIQSNLVVLYKTKPSPSHPIVVKPDVPQNVVEKFTNAFLALGTQNPKLLQEVEFTNPTQTTYQEYKYLENLKLEKFVILEK